MARYTIRRRAMPLLAMSAIVCGSALVGGSSSAAAPELAAGRSVGIEPHNNFFGSNWLTGVKALAPNDVWVVGNHPNSKTDYQPVMRHYDGVTWKRVGHFGKRAGDRCIPTAVDARSDDDVWVSCTHQLRRDPFVEHWDGTSWQLQDIPGIGDGINQLWSVWEDTPDDVWAVGQYLGGTHGVPYGIVVHFDGQRWKQMQLPLSEPFELYGVSGTSPSDVWAVGHSWDRSQTLALHYDGTSWQVVASPTGNGGSGFDSLVALSPTDAWAVGWAYEGNFNGLVARWDGTKWVDTKATTVSHAYLQGVSALSDDDVWVVGAGVLGATASHWDGHEWTSHPPRYPGDGDSRLTAVSMANPDNVWTVGHWERQSRGLRTYQYWDSEDWHRHTP